MNKKDFFMKKPMCVLSLTTFLLVNLGGTVLAAKGNTENKQPNNQIYSNLLLSSNKNIDMKKNNRDQLRDKELKSSALKDNTPSDSKIQMPKEKLKQNLKNAKVVKTNQAAKMDKYPMSYLKTLSYSDLVNTISTIQWDDIPDLFQYNNDSYEFYSDQNRIQALIDGLYQRASQFTAEDSKGIPTLVEVIRAGFYLGFYNDKLSYLNDRNFHNKCIPAIIQLEKNPNFKLGTAVQDAVVSSTGKLIWNGSCNLEVVDRAVPILKQYNNNVNTFIEDNGKGDAVYEIMGGIEYDISTYTAKVPYKTTEWYRNIDSFINELEKMALLGNLNSDNGWLINNGLYYMGSLGKFHTDPNKGNQVLTKALNMYPYLGEQYFQAAQQIVNNYGGIDYNGNKIDMESLKEQGKKHYLPNNYTFDDGRVIVNTGDKVSVDKVKKLYWASKEVEAQFFKAIGSDTALEPNNPDKVLKIVIYNSPAEYKMNTLLNGLDTNNGGMYMEGMGTFFTYERTTDESIYTLEELFRHEFTHYLQGRYLVPGMWGDGDMYKNGRLTWFEEGGAEFFAGSTRTSGVLPRKSVVGNISTNPSDRYSVSKTVHSQYGSFEFYNYGFAFVDYMYQKNFGMLSDINNIIKSNNVSAYDNYINKISSDSNLNKQYQDHMQYLVDNYNNLTTPLVSDDYLANHPVKKNSEIYSDITKVSGLKDVTTTESKSQFFNTFTLKGSYVGGTAQGKLTDLKTMEKTANNFLKTLESYPWSGYKTVTCYFTNYRVNSSNNFEFDVVFRGRMTEEVTNKAPIAKINGPYSGVSGQEIKFNSTGSNDSDGKIVSYSWSFGDGTTSTEANPSHSYSKAGTYNVTLKVTDDKGATATESTTVNVSAAPVDGISKEYGSNDTFETANGPIFAGKTVTGAFDKNDSKDIYYFDVTTEGKIDIEVNNKNSLGMNWMLYSEADLQNYVSYADIQGSKLLGSYNAKPGRYYLYIYKYSGTNGSYDINIQGPLNKLVK